MTLLNMIAIYLLPEVGLSLSMAFLLLAFALTKKIPDDETVKVAAGKEVNDNSEKIFRLLGFLCVFIVIISINSGLMYQTVNPDFSNVEWLIGWYWALPYLIAIAVIRNLPEKISRNYILYIAITMMGLSFILFIVMGRSVISYLIINTLMLGACGVYDLFWWSILGEFLEYHKNSAKILGIGLSANVLGIFIGGLADKAISVVNIQNFSASLLALTIVCVTLALLPPLNKNLSRRLADHVYLKDVNQTIANRSNLNEAEAFVFENLSVRKRQVAKLLAKGKTYKIIASELYISENTVKYFAKNIYSKCEVQNRSQLIEKIHNHGSGVKT
jgi:DNA-binding CsgD family transcriptional regulator